MYQCFAFGIDHNDIAIGSSQLDLGGKTNIISYDIIHRSSKNYYKRNDRLDIF